MIDVYRFVLALCVVQGHLLAGGPSWLAWQAVFSFYVLSGFLMTLVLTEVYGFGLGNFVRFSVNRILRLFPGYYLVVALTVLCIGFVSPLNQLNGALVLPETSREIWSNLFIFGQVGIDQDDLSPHRLVPTAWSLSIELFCYVLLALYFSVSVRRLVGMFAIGVIVTMAHLAWALTFGAPNYGFFDHYVVLQAGLIPFSVGGLAYFYRGLTIFDVDRWRLVSVFSLGILNAVAGYFSDFHKEVLGLYCSVVLSFLLVPMLFRRDQGRERKRWESILGGMSYPIFISHWLLGTLVYLYFTALTPYGAAHFALAMAASLLFALVVHFGVDRPVETLRVKLKRYTGIKRMGGAPRLECDRLVSANETSALRDVVRVSPDLP